MARPSTLALALAATCSHVGAVSLHQPVFRGAPAASRCASAVAQFGAAGFEAQAKQLRDQAVYEAALAKQQAEGDREPPSDVRAPPFREWQAKQAQDKAAYEAALAKQQAAEGESTGLGFFYGQPEVHDGAVGSENEVMRGDPRTIRSTMPTIASAAGAAAAAEAPRAESDESTGLGFFYGQPEIHDGAVGSENEVMRGDPRTIRSTMPTIASAAGASAAAEAPSEPSDASGAGFFYAHPVVEDGAVGSDSEVKRGSAPYRNPIPTINGPPTAVVGRVVPTGAPAESVVYGQPEITDGAVGSDSEVSRGPQAPARNTIASPGKPFA